MTARESYEALHRIWRNIFGDEPWPGTDEALRWIDIETAERRAMAERIDTLEKEQPVLREMAERRCKVTETAVARAHDILHFILTQDDVRNRVIPPAEQQYVLQNLLGNLDVLCWMLGHSHNQHFQQNMTVLTVRLEAAGFPEHLLREPDGS